MAPQALKTEIIIYIIYICKIIIQLHFFKNVSNIYRLLISLYGEPDFPSLHDIGHQPSPAKPEKGSGKLKPTEVEEARKSNVPFFPCNVNQGPGPHP